MAFSEYLADRIRHSLKENKAAFEEKKMFGGLCWFVEFISLLQYQSQFAGLCMWHL